jgi:glycerol 3-phosphatase-2
MTSDGVLVGRYDGALFDLDGVIYLGPTAVPGVASVVAGLRARGTRLGFVTNNAARTPAEVAAHLRDLRVDAEPCDVVTSAQAGAHLLRERFGAGARVLVVGGRALETALTDSELIGVRSAEEKPVAVIQGWSADLTWEQLNEAAIAIQRGAHWLATNTDSTRPTERGIVPGNGAAVAAVRVAVDTDPEVAGKPYAPLFRETVLRIGAERPIFVGDRLDTDVAGAAQVGLDSLLVLTGAHGAAEVLAAPAGARPTYLGWDASALLEPPLLVSLECGRASCSGQTAVLAGPSLALLERPSGRSETVAALWAAAALAWRAADQGESLDHAPVLDQLVGLR